MGGIGPHARVGTLQRSSSSSELICGVEVPQSAEARSTLCVHKLSGGAMDDMVVSRKARTIVLVCDHARGRFNHLSLGV